MDVTLRSATGDDIDALFAIHRAAIREYVEQAYGPWDERWQQQYFVDHFDVTVRAVVQAEGEPIGFIDLVTEPEALVVWRSCWRRRCRRPASGRS